MKFCPNCGVMLNDQDAVCPNCGQEQATAQTDTYADIFVQSQEQPAQDPQYPAYSESQPYYAAQPQYPVEYSAEPPVNYYNAPVYPEQPAPKKKVKWWMVAVPVVLVIAIAVALLWNPLMLRLAPEAMLAKALSQTGEELAERNAGNPLLALTNAWDPCGATMVLDVTGYEPTAGQIGIGIEYRFNVESGRYQLDFDLANSGEDLDATLYMDAEHLTIGSERLLKGEHFGITFDTFSRDIRGNELFAGVDEEQLTALEDAVRILQDATTLEQTAISEEYAAVLTEFATNLEAGLDSEARSVGGEERKVDTISYTFTFDELADLLEQLLEIMENDEGMRARMTYGFAVAEDGEELWEEMIDEYDYVIDEIRDTDGDITVTFGLYRYNLVCVTMDMSGVYDDESIGLVLDVDLGTDTSADDIVYTIRVKEDGEEGVIVVTQSTLQSEDRFEETFNIQVTSPYDESENAEISCKWDRSSGDLTLALRSDGEKMELALVLKADVNGFTLSVDDLFGMLAGAGMENAEYYEGVKLGFSLEVTKGAAISMPQFKNIDAWTQGDILDLAQQMQSLGR